MSELHADDFFQPPREMIALRQPEVPASLMVHQADLDLVAVLAPDRFRTGASHGVEVSFDRVDVSVERAGVQDREAHPGPQEGRLVQDRVPTARGRLGHVRRQSRLPVCFRLNDILPLRTSLRPVDPEPGPVADENPSQFAGGRSRLHAEEVGFLQPHPVRAGGQNAALGLALIAAGIGQGPGLMHRLDHPVVRRVCGGIIGEGRRVKTRGIDGRSEQEPGGSAHEENRGADAPASGPRKVSCIHGPPQLRMSFPRSKWSRVLARRRQPGSGAVVRPV